jgi:hypothetical protein
VDEGDAVTPRLLVFICHPYGGDPRGNAEKIGILARLVLEEGHLPIAPQLFLPQFVSEDNERHIALEACAEYVRISDEIRVYGVPTEGMRKEIEVAHAAGIPVKTGEPF